MAATGEGGVRAKGRNECGKTVASDADVHSRHPGWDPAGPHGAAAHREVNQVPPSPSDLPPALS